LRQGGLCFKQPLRLRAGVKDSFLTRSDFGIREPRLDLTAKHQQARLSGINPRDLAYSLVLSSSASLFMSCPCDRLRQGEFCFKRPPRAAGAKAMNGDGGQLFDKK